VHFLAVVAVFGLLILAHEFGHFLLAKKAGVKVDEFAIGFGPSLLAFRRGETVYSLRLFLLGGYVRMAGMFLRPDEEPPPPGRGFNDQGLGKRLAIVFAGPAMNFALAWSLFFVLLALFGVPKEPTLRLARVQPGWPAWEAGLRAGDEILSVDGTRIESWRELQRKIAASAGHPVELGVRREGREFRVTVTPVKGPEERGVIGVAPVMSMERVPPSRALGESARWTWSVVAGTVQAIGSALRGQGEVTLIGPVGITREIGEASRLGVVYLLMITALLSANLGLLNLLPIPALDGSRILFLLWELVRGKRMAPEREHLLHLIGFTLLILLMLAITYRDLARLG